MASYHKIEPIELKATVDEVADTIKKLKKKIKFERIVCCGISGMSIAFPVSYLTGIQVCVVRKPNEESHGKKIENFAHWMDKVTPRRYLILDDLIENGETIDYMIKTIKTEYSLAKCVRIVLYNHGTKDTKYKKIPVTVIN